MRWQTPASETWQQQRPRTRFALMALVVVVALAAAFLIHPEGNAVAKSADPPIALPESDALPSALSPETPSGVVPPANVSTSELDAAAERVDNAAPAPPKPPGRSNPPAATPVPVAPPPPTTVPDPSPAAPAEVRT